MSEVGGDIRVIPVSEAPWDDVRTVFGTRGDPAGCFCQYFKVDAATWKAQDVAGFERALCEQVDAARVSRDRAPGAGSSRTGAAHRAAPGVLAYLGDEPVGWAAVEPRTAYPGVLSGRVIPASAQPDLGDELVWAITCFVVRVGYRRRGVGAALLGGAVDAARRGGARVVEAYPVDTAGAKVSSAELYHGPLSTFVAAGFTVSGRPLDSRAVVELTL